MGIDARLLIKVPPSKRGPFTNLAELSYRLASTIGRQAFFITDEHHAISDVGQVWEQDGPDIHCPPGWQFLEVHLWSRYYSPDYAGGDWKILRMVIQWWFNNHPECEVWYGGDSSGVCVERMTPAKVEEFDRFYLATGNSTYHNVFGRSDSPICPRCTVGMNSCGGGRGQVFFCCHGCGMTAITKAGDTYLFAAARSEADLFADSKMLEQGLAKPAPFINKAGKP